VIHIRVRGESYEHAGEIGKESLDSRENDAVRISVRLNEPAHCYLVAFNPDGSKQLCWPDAESTPPPATRTIDYPSRSADAFYLTDGAGQQVFALIASRRPLPKYAAWSQQQDNVPWSRTEPVSLPPLRFDTSEPPVHDTLRGSVGKLKGAAALEELCLYLKNTVPADVVHAVTFPVRSATN
jgi:hypothetical protein